MGKKDKMYQTEIPPDQQESPQEDTLQKILDRVEALEAENTELKKQIVTPIKDGRGIEFDDSLNVDPSVVRVKILPDLVPSSPEFQVRYASTGTIDRRLAEGWRPIEGAKTVGDAIPVEIRKDNPLLRERKKAQEFLKTRHLRQVEEDAAMGRKRHSNGVTTFAEYERRRE